MAVRSLTGVPIFLFIPPSYSPIYLISVVKSDGTTYDVTDIIHEGEYTDGVTETIGNFTFTIDNSEETYTTLFALFDKVNVYMDYDTTATTLRFKGIIEKITKTDNKLKVIGRGTGSRVMGATVTQRYASQYTHDIIQDLISKYHSQYITTTNIDTTDSTDTQVTVNWYQKSFWECILDLCNRSGYDAYIDCNFDFHYFVSGSQSNTDECVVHEQNLIETGDFAPDLTTIKNRIIVYGAKIEDQQIVWMEEDDTSITGLGYGVKEEIINDSSIITVAQAQARAEYELSLKKDPPIIGEVTSLGLPTLLPGERVRISDPLNGLDPGYYSIQKFTHKFSNDEPMQTVLTVYKEISTIPKILKKRITFETESSEMENPNEMRYSWLFDFNTDSGTHSSTQIANGVLKTDGSASGTWISKVNALSENATSCELRAKVNATGSDYYVSTDNGITWQSISLNTLLALSPPGQNLKIKIILNSASTEIDSLCLLYK